MALCNLLGRRPQQAACLLAEGTSTLRNVPDIGDVPIMAEVLAGVDRSKGTKFAALVPTSDLGEGIAAWIERRPPRYRGRKAWRALLDADNVRDEFREPVRGAVVAMDAERTPGIAATCCCTRW